jgi:uncharacterized membrane protein (DUF106 family)
MDKVTEHATKTINDGIEKVVSNGIDKYGDFLFGLVVGLTIAYFYNKLIGRKALKDSYEKLIEGKDEYISLCKNLVLERLKDIQVEQKDKQFFSRLRKFFKIDNINLKEP